MTQLEIINYCLTLKGTYTDFPFGNDVLVIKVKVPSTDKSRIMAQFFELKGEPKVTFYCSFEGSLYYRSLYPDIVTRGYHCPLVQQPYFNTFTVNGSVPRETIIEMANHAYHSVIKKLPKYAQKELLDK